MSQLVYDPDEPIHIKRVRNGQVQIEESIKLPAPGFTARSVVEYVTRDEESHLVETAPSETPPIEAGDPDRAAFLIGAFTVETTGSTTDLTSLSDRYNQFCTLGRDVLSTAGVPTFVRFNHTDLQLLDMPDTFLKLSVNASMYGSDDDRFHRPPARRGGEWMDRFGDIPVETFRIRQPA